MNVEAEECVPDAATACKRLKRTHSKDESCSEEAAAAAADGSKVDLILVGKEANVAANTHNNNNNNNRNKSESELGTGNVASAADADKNTMVDTSSETLSDLILETESCSPRLFPIRDSFDSTDEPAIINPPDIFSDSSSSNPFLDLLPGEPGYVARNNTARNNGDGNAENVDAAASSRTFNRPRTQRTRSYRSTLSNLESSSSASGSDLQYNSDTNDADVDEDDADVAAEAANAEEDESRSPEAQLLDESSSDSSGAFWNRFYTSSNEENDSDDDYNEAEANPADKEQIEIAVNKVLCKSKPSYNWNFAQELMRREHNLFNRIGWRGGHTSALSFGQGYYGSRQVVERMKLMNALSMHRCCVNCLSFNRTGDLICSGSDDLSIIVWDWANGRPRHSFKSGHSLNIFQTKFIDSVGCLDVVSSSRDGQVRRAVIPPSGSSSIKPVRLYSHNDAVHKLVVVPHSKHEVISAGEDAAVKHFDLRTNACTTMLRCVSSDDNRRVRLFSIAHHPYVPEFCVSGSDDKLRVYDKRKLTSPVHEMTPKDLKDTKITQITCAVYNHSGSEILASYSDAGIYLYDSRNYKDGEFLHSYEGHINSRTIKGVNFFGPHSEYIISGSDCGNIFFWDKNTEAVINFVKGDHAGVVNCLEQHPSMPVLATSGLDHNVKIWTPSGLSEAEVPRTDALKETLQRNFRRSLLDVGDFDINQIHYFIRQLIEPRRSAGGAAGGGEQGGPRERNRNLFRSSSSSSSSSISSSPGNADAAANQEPPRRRDSNPSSSDEGNADPLGCRSQ
ncbi:DDB1- and CUL4-associated factor 8 isoform X1 [Drosophila virilis]|uniref:Uncharacterized protein, isoform A n=1 Tax=Drosophila virilis TaxID=7244 RepID=B4MGN0_DROVI|nr:DDB1- and CUL4-associated factor 8 isoform X1 [Drosophila virilis]EDW57096.1 uncharacterized protein Dvir_GJ16058, isoform A [Drosophila virilis]